VAKVHPLGRISTLAEQLLLSALRACRLEDEHATESIENDAISGVAFASHDLVVDRDQVRHDWQSLSFDRPT